MIGGFLVALGYEVQPWICTFCDRRLPRRNPKPSICCRDPECLRQYDAALRKAQLGHAPRVAVVQRERLADGTQLLTLDCGHLKRVTFRVLKPTAICAACRDDAQARVIEAAHAA